MEQINYITCGTNKQMSERIIKASVVIAGKKVQKLGELVIPAPIGVGIDKSTGKPTAPIQLKVIGEPVLRPQVLPDTLINEGFVTVRLEVEDNDPQPCPDVRKGFIKNFVIPIQSVLEINGIRPGDHVEEHAVVRSLTVFAVPEQCNTNSVGNEVKLILKIILDVEIIITRDEIITVPIKCY